MLSVKVQLQSSQTSGLCAQFQSRPKISLLERAKLFLRSSSRPSAAQVNSNECHFIETISFPQATNFDGNFLYFFDQHHNNKIILRGDILSSATRPISTWLPVSAISLPNASISKVTCILSPWLDWFITFHVPFWTLLHLFPNPSTSNEQGLTVQ